MSAYYDQGGQRVRIGRRIGGGGEGDVFVVNRSAPPAVAKIFKVPASQSLADKLNSMIARCPAPLAGTAAWPERVLHARRGGPVVGFTMPQMGDVRPIHELFNPGDRYREFPEANWSFLTLVAANLAAVFAHLHANDIVMGDVNQRNFMVTSNALVRVIDCDSFQVRTTSALFRCSVGTAEYTSPELQNAGSFANVVRTSDHDLFGLAVLCFQLLFAGRHPYAISGGPDIPTAIRTGATVIDNGQGINFWRGPTPRHVGPELAGLFRRAFALGGASRPTALEWCAALGRFQTAFVACPRDGNHQHLAASGACPWCEFERHFGMTVFRRRSPAPAPPLATAAMSIGTSQIGGGSTSGTPANIPVVGTPAAVATSTGNGNAIPGSGVFTPVAGGTGGTARVRPLIIPSRIQSGPPHLSLNGPPLAPSPRASGNSKPGSASCGPTSHFGSATMPPSPVTQAAPPTSPPPTPQDLTPLWTQIETFRLPPLAPPVARKHLQFKPTPMPDDWWTNTFGRLGITSPREKSRRQAAVEAARSGCDLRLADWHRAHQQAVQAIAAEVDRGGLGWRQWRQREQDCERQVQEIAKANGLWLMLVNWFRGTPDPQIVRLLADLERERADCHRRLLECLDRLADLRRQLIGELSLKSADVMAAYEQLGQAEADLAAC